MVRSSLSSKKGTSLIELLAYISLYGVVMSLLATLVFVLTKTARSVNRQSILNRGTKILYTEFMGQAINFNADYVVVNETINDTVSVTLEKRYRYDNEGERIKIVAGDTVYANKPVKLTYSYKKGDNKMGIKYEYLDGRTIPDATVDLDNGVTISSSTENDTDISNIFTVVTKSSYSKSLIFNGKLTFDKKSVEFNFVIPVYVINE